MTKWYPYEIAYCANVHPGTTASAIENNILTITSAVKNAVGLERMYSGLWICEDALAEYQQDDAVARLKQTLADSNLSVVTFNGFPQEDFHQDVVKKNVYQPDWSTDRRLNYTIELAKLLAKILPSDIDEGSISTLPLGYRENWSIDAQRQASTNIFAYAKAADALYKATGKRIRLCLEMEPGCVLERTDQTIAYFNKYLKDFSRLQGVDYQLVLDNVGLCYDICHQAVMNENVTQSFQDVSDAGIVVGKIQVSSALKVMDAKNSDAQSLLQQFSEPKYLHQTTVIAKDGKSAFYNDLPDALASVDKSIYDEWRVHFHLPIQATAIDLNNVEVESVTTTRDAIEECLQCLAQGNQKPHIEIETYTWQVLPSSLYDGTQACLIKGLAREHQWLKDTMSSYTLIK